MNFSYPFIRRPIGTALLAIGLFLVGAVAYRFLPVASLPNIEFPTIRVGANRPGADPNTMAASVAAPLERRLAEIAGVTEITSISSLGSTSITVQFDLNRSIDGAARDVQAAINAAASDLPTDLPTVPYFKKSNPAAAPILILALTSNTIAPSAIYDIADSVIAQRIAQVQGVAEVTVNGAEQPAVRVRVDPAAIASMGLGMDDVRAAIVKSNAAGPIGMFDGRQQLQTIATNDQLFKPADYDPVIVRTASGSVVRLSAIASIESGVRNTLSAAWFNGQPSVLLIITKQAGANVIETIDHIHQVLGELKGWIPADLQISVLSDRTKTIRASVHDMQLTLVATIMLVVLVVFLFLRRGAPTVAAGITVPLSLAGTCALMWVAGYSIDNLSLMALAVSVGFVVDDAIVMIENVFRNLEAGRSPLRATLEGARQIGFTVVSISVSLIAAFIPLLFMGGIVGRLFREFSVTLAFAIVVSMAVSLSVTPMVCAHFIRAPPSADSTRLDRVADSVLDALIRAYGRTLSAVLRHRALTLLVMLLTVTLTVSLYIKGPKGYFPQDDTGLLIGATQASSDISFKAMSGLQQRAAAIVKADPAVASVGSSIGTSTFNPSINQGRLFISLKPLSERKLSIARIADRLRGELARVTGLRVFLVPTQDLRVGARLSKSQYQFTLWSSDIEELTRWTPKILEQVRKIPGLIDVASDREQGGLQANLVIDRQAAARLCVNVQDIDNALGDAFAQAQVSTIYGARNQYRVILEIDPRFQRDPSSLSQVFVKASGSASGDSGCAGAIAIAQATNAATGVISGISSNEVPLSAVARFEKTLAPLVVNHQGQFPSVTISYNLASNIGLEEANARIQRAVADLHLPGTIHSEVAGDVKAFARTVGAQPVLLVAALIAVYIVLGVLYESLAHPITIISTLPSAGLGALLALRIFGAELTVIAFIGIILLIGIVKKNGIMMVDFALEAERRRGLPPERAIFEACLERFRPILMTTMAAMLGAVPLALATGPGAELRRPLGITIIGGLLVSQVLTLYTTPVIYLLLDGLHHRLWPAPLVFDAEGHRLGGRDR
ncbi:efflux RND transporter permease subunit [Bradyrhizobium sp. ISRA443]|uniref:efflux RND transporter permease subunit n=1 Tax=unclassified Bradyrhizobium TaxID=2631580 RepID=UPI00247A5B27|nr:MULTISPECIES: efflux RND transporter permease subunit [unclassified Bradyrhizobium]WGS02075.1 efflux RND transporter permease subunit [Bradyrhizobium sp. ISRA436]WGS08960.1 efflux RND transporter permease subunit [Bradyrhizobium sp. ISRA437]WGS15849.1 efflux RND transporter permease subunit [Bradyrhizobium sp. ISRA443]